MKTTTTLERVYNDMLGVLPPAAMLTSPKGVNAFLVGEPTNHDTTTGLPRFASYFSINDLGEPLGHYVTGPNMTRQEFATLLANPDIVTLLTEDETTPDNIATELELIEQTSLEAVNAYHELGIELNHELENFEEAYAGQWDSPEDFAQNMAGALSDKVAVSWPYTCIDWTQAARELMYDYSEQDGHYFRNL